MVAALRRVFDWPVEWNVKQMAEFCMEPAKQRLGGACPGIELRNAGAGNKIRLLFESDIPRRCN
jgi:hypothetical protein